MVSTSGFCQAVQITCSITQQASCLIPSDSFQERETTETKLCRMRSGSKVNDDLINASRSGLDVGNSRWCIRSCQNFPSTRTCTRYKRKQDCDCNSENKRLYSRRGGKEPVPLEDEET